MFSVNVSESLAGGNASLEVNALSSYSNVTSFEDPFNTSTLENVVRNTTFYMNFTETFPDGYLYEIDLRETNTTVYSGFYNTTKAAVNTSFTEFDSDNTTYIYREVVNKTIFDLYNVSSYETNFSFFDNISLCFGQSCLSNWSNQTNGTIFEHPTKGTYWALFLLLFPFLTIFGNILVILSVYREKSLQSATNYFIVSLAFADLLVAALVMPFAVYLEITGSFWGLSETLCDAWIATDVIASTSSIFNLTAISVDRFIAVTQPIKYAKHKNSKRVSLTIAIVWVVSAAIGLPIVLGLNTSQERTPHLCVFYNSDFIIYSSLSSFFIPCVIMAILYYKIFRAIRERAKKSAAHKKPPLSAAKHVIENTPQVAKMQETTLNSTAGSKTTGTQITLEEPTNTASGSNEDEDDFRDDDEGARSPNSEDEAIPNESTEFMLSPVNKETQDYPVNSDSGYSAPINVEIETQFSTPNSPKKNLLIPPKKKLTDVVDKSSKRNGAAKKLEITKPHQSSEKKNVTKFNFGLRTKSRTSQKKKEKLSAKKERKATKTLAIVLGVFLFCWVPFFTANILNAICIKMYQSCEPDLFVFTFTTWLGYVNSFMNPVIYTIFNPEFRKAFQKLLCMSRV